MQKKPVVTSQLSPSKFNEQVLVVKRSDIFSLHEAWHGLKAVNFDDYVAVINDKKEFQSRGLMEEDPSYKQIIPYLVFKHEDKYFLMRRSGSSSEERLANKYSLGIGGHIRQEDLGENSVFEWARREFHEEINYDDDVKVTPLGILNDDTNSVGQVHIGFVLLLEGTDANISIKSELQEGNLVSLEQCISLKDSMETWSAMVVDFLAENG